jgi:PTH1 family peptidyl-tRNA hydrolase
MKMVVGLGNPGSEYEKTRHNIGFMVLDKLSSDYTFDKKYNAMICKKGSIIYVKPQTFMNLSGESVSKIARFYDINSENILVVHDDIDMEFGKIKYKKSSSHGGQNGIKSIIDHLGTQDFPRVKIGIGRDQFIPVHNYVLGKFTPEQNKTLTQIIDNAILKIDETLEDM